MCYLSKLIYFLIQFKLCICEEKIQKTNYIISTSEENKLYKAVVLFTRKLLVKPFRSFHFH